VVTGAWGTRPTGHGLKNRGHREMAGVKGNPPRPIRRSEGSAETAVAMAGGRKLVGARKTGSTGHETRNKLHGERRENGEAHSGEKRGRRRLRDGGSRGGVDGGSR
jgi:hypothetical protein